jgi:hypothetical protein
MLWIKSGGCPSAIRGTTIRPKQLAEFVKRRLFFRCELQCAPNGSSA